MYLMVLLCQLCARQIQQLKDICNIYINRGWRLIKVNFSLMDILNFAHHLLDALGNIIFDRCNHRSRIRLWSLHSDLSWFLSRAVKSFRENRFLVSSWNILVAGWKIIDFSYKKQQTANQIMDIFSIRYAWRCTINNQTSFILYVM